MPLVGKSRRGALVGLLVVMAALPAVAAAGPPERPHPDAVPGVESRLVGLARAAERAGSGERVIVQVLDGGGAENAVSRRGGRVLVRKGPVVTVELPAVRLLALAADPGVAFVFELDVPHTEDHIVSQGVAFHGADAWHAAGFDGSGIGILVLDMGFSDYPNDGLPSATGTAVGASCPSGAEINEGGSHGTAVAEIVRDMAPGAEIHLFRTCSTADADQIVAYVVAHDIEIVTQSLGYFNTGPLDGSDPLGSLSFISDSVAAGALWFNSVGNYRRGHWGGAWVDNGSGVHHFGPGAFIEMQLTAGDVLYLRWDDWTVDFGCAGCASTVNLDLHLTDTSGVDVPKGWASSTTIQSPGAPGIPREKIEVKKSGTYRIEVRYQPSGPIPSGMQIDLFSPKRDLPSVYRVPARSLNDPSTFSSVIAVGAVHHSDGLHEKYSSGGPTADGRVKPDVTAADCVDSWSSQSASGFCGTSAAAPHAAGAAALILQATGAPTSELRGLLLGLTDDGGPAGPDNQYGFGVLALGSAPSGSCGGVAGTIVALPGQIEIHGTPGRDVIVGNDEANRIWGYAGRDRICGKRGADIIWPGSGKDWVRGGPGSDRIVYESGNDSLRGNKGARDLLDFRAMPGRVRVDLRAGTASVGGFTLSVGGFTRVFGGSGDDVIKGSQRDEVLKGFGGDDVLRGRGGKDRLHGGSGDDRLYGGSGKDRLNGGGGWDVLNGGNGFDVCINGPVYENCEA